MKWTSLSNGEVTDALQHLTGFKPCNAKDTYKGKIKSHESSVVNLDNSNGLGTHFTCYFNAPNNEYVYYFDSYGTVPPPQIEKYLKSTGKQIQYNSSQYQPIASQLCGYYCIYVLKQLYSGKSFYDVLSNFNMNSPEANDEFVKSQFNHGHMIGRGSSEQDDNNNNDGNILGDVVGNVAKEGISTAITEGLADVIPEGVTELLPLLLL